MKKLKLPHFGLFTVVLLLSGIVSSGCGQKPGVPVEEVTYSDNQIIADAYRDQTSNQWVSFKASVVKILQDDLKTPRHQRFIVRLDHGQTLLISHNIDLAPRVKNLQLGDEVLVYGEYEYNEKGGVVHWTHHDPAGRQMGGWIEHQGKRYR